MDPEYTVPSSTTLTPAQLAQPQPQPQLQTQAQSQAQQPQVKQRPGTAEEQQQPPKVHCKYPGCTKAFIRKEHLNRHMRGHELIRPHICYMCNRSFARKDILHRHVLQHNSPPDDGPKRTLLACETCRRRKVKCDSDDPCSACEASSIPCIRRSSSSQSRMERLQLQQQQQNQQQPGENTLFEEENDDDVGDNEDGPDDLPGSGESWDDRAGDESSKNQSAPRSSSSRSSQSHIGSVVQAHRTPASGSASAPPPTPVAPIPTMVPSLSLFRLPSGNSLTPSTGSRLTAGSESAPQTTNATPISEHPPHLSLASAAAMTFTLPDVSVPPDAAVRASNELPGMDDFMEWMDSVDTNELNHMLLPHPNILTPPAEDPIQLETLFHKFWPLLHLPTFSMDMATPALTHALGHIKDWVQQKAVSDAIVWDVNSNIKLLPNFMQSISGDINLSSSSRTMSIGTLQFVQALGLIAACAITGNSPPAIFEWATLCSDMCTAYLRHMGVYQGTRKIEQPFHIADERWIMEEQFNRLVTIERPNLTSA